MSRASTAAPPDSRPGVGGLGGTDTGEQVLLPEEPLPIAAPLSEFDGARAVRAAAGDKQFHIALLLTGNMVAFHPDGIGLVGCVIVVGGRAGKVGEGKVGLSVTEAVV